jgi:hypothetical protein
MSNFDVNFNVVMETTEIADILSYGPVLVANYTDSDLRVKIEDVDPVTNPPEDFIFQVLVESNSALTTPIDGLEGDVTLTNASEIALYFTLYVI